VETLNKRSLNKSAPFAGLYYCTGSICVCVCVYVLGGILLLLRSGVKEEKTIQYFCAETVRNRSTRDRLLEKRRCVDRIGLVRVS